MFSNLGKRIVERAQSESPDTSVLLGLLIVRTLLPPSYESPVNLLVACSGMLAAKIHALHILSGLIEVENKLHTALDSGISDDRHGLILPGSEALLQDS